MMRGPAPLCLIALTLLPASRLPAAPPQDGPPVFLLNPATLVAAKAAIERREILADDGVTVEGLERRRQQR